MSPPLRCAYCVLLTLVAWRLGGDGNQQCECARHHQHGFWMTQSSTDTCLWARTFSLLREAAKSGRKWETGKKASLWVFFCVRILAHLTPHLGTKYAVCHISVGRLLTPFTKHWRRCQLKSPLSKPFTIWLLQLLLTQLVFSFAFTDNLETEPVPVPAVLSNLNGYMYLFIYLFSMLLSRTACWWLIFSDSCWLFSCHFQLTGWGKMALMALNSGNCWSGNKSPSAWGLTQYSLPNKPSVCPET